MTSNRCGLDPDIPNAVAATMILSLNRVKSRNPRSDKIISIMTFFDCHAVPASLLLGHNELPTSREFVEAIGKLQAFSPVSKTSVGDNFEVHRLVHVVTHKWLIIQNMLEYGALEALDALRKVLPESLKKKDGNDIDSYLPRALHYPQIRTQRQRC